MVKPRRATPDAVPHVVVLFGATGDLARRKLLPGLFHLSRSKLAPQLRIVGTSLDDLDDEAFRAIAVSACEQFSHAAASSEECRNWAQNLTYVPQGGGPEALATAVREQAGQLDGEPRLLHYLSVPPAAAIPALRTLEQATLVDGAAVIMEKPFGTDLASAVALNASIHQTFDESQIFRIDHFLGKEPAQHILAFRFGNGLFEPIWNRTFIDHVQIDIPEKLSLEGRAAFYEPTGAFKDMVVTHPFQGLAFVAMEAPTELASDAISVEKNKVFRSMVPLDPRNVVRGQYRGYRDEPGVARDSDTETFVALRCDIDNWRWAGVPFYLRTGKCLAEGQRIISIAFREPPRSMFPPGSGVGAHGPDHLTFDLADQAKVSLSFYGKRPGPGMKLDKHSMQFEMAGTEAAGDVLEVYERLILDAMHGDHTLYTASQGIERLWEVSAPLLDDPPPVRGYDIGSWGPNAIHQLIAPHAWRLPFDRAWRAGR
jgi:glucose-6-phosphate 1-dehydrogenase